MKQLVILLNLIGILCSASAQTKSMIKIGTDKQRFGVKLTLQGNGLATKGFDALNSELQKNQINTLPNDFITQGFSLHAWANQVIGFEFAFNTITSKLETTDKFKGAGIPYLSGNHLKFACFGNIFRKNRFSIGVSLGVSTNVLVFEIVDLQPQPNTLGSLLTNPSLSRTLAFESPRIPQMEAALGIDFQLLRREKSELTIGIKGGYNYQPFKQSRFLKWTTKRTNVRVDSFPLVFLDSYFLQFNLAFNFVLE